MNQEELLKQLKALAIKRLDVIGLMTDVLDLMLKPTLDKIVKDSANPYDDMAMAALYPVLDKFLKDELLKLQEKLKEL